jgi:hypothetical protein
MVGNVDRRMQQGGRRSNPQALIEDLVDLLLAVGERSSRRKILRTLGPASGCGATRQSPPRPGATASAAASCQRLATES